MTSKKDKEMRKWIKNNLVTAKQGREITGQSQSGFSNSVTDGYIPVFVNLNEDSERPYNLYLREDLEDYKNRKREQRLKKDDK